MIKTTQCYLMREGSWLMLYRNKKENDYNHGKWIGVGGKQEPGETSEQCIIREIREETGLTAEAVTLRGIVEFEYPGLEEEEIRVYTCTQFSGELTSCSEGTLEWIPEGRIMDLSLWEGDRVFLEKLLHNDTEVFRIRLKYDTDDRLREVITLEA